jgi:hypothetical protein
MATATIFFLLTVIIAIGQLLLSRGRTFTL